MEHQQQQHHQHVIHPAVVSGDEHVSSTVDESSVASHDDDEEDLKYDTLHYPNDLYGKDMDEQDEAWVYKHMRGGVPENVSIIQKKVNGSSTTTTKQLKVLKPRNSDAVLSCPCCFTIVCMDCQRHEKFENQFRAMFVMNIGVDWNKKLVYSKDAKGLVEKTLFDTTAAAAAEPQTTTANRVLEDHPTQQQQQDEEVYYSVHCINCQTEVAALNMDDEVYHFFGCLESA